MTFPNQINGIRLGFRSVGPSIRRPTAALLSIRASALRDAMCVQIGHAGKLFG